jgi:DNA-binding GntR family transcriptional regulator
MATELNKIAPDNLMSRAYQEIKTALTAGQFKPGDRLAIRKLAQQLGTSPTPVREALLKLVSYGALEMAPAHPITVPVLTKTRYLENRTIRIVNEGLAAFEAAKKIKSTDLEKLKNLNAEMIEAYRDGRYTDVLIKNHSFHLELCKASRMTTLVDIVEILWLQIGPSLNLLYTEKNLGSESYHPQILHALEDRNPAAAKLAIENDIIHGGAPLLSYFDRQD